MKKYGKSLSFLLVMALLLSLAACVQNPDVTTASDGDNITTGGNVPPTTGIDSPAATTKPIVLDIDLTDPWTTPDMYYGDVGALTEFGYYHLTDNGLLTFTDISNGITVILCHKAGCTHAGDDLEECEAVIPACSILFHSNGYIYFDRLVKDDPNKVHLFRRKADGTAEEKIAVLGEDYISYNTSIVIGQSIAADGALYFSLSAMEDVVQDDGSIAIMERDSLLIRLDLNTGKQKEIAHFSDVFIQLFGARNDALLFYTQDTLPSEEIGKPDYYERTEKLPARLRVWSESSGGCVTLFEKPNKECVWIHGLQNDRIYYYDHEGMYAYDLATGEFQTTELPLDAQIISENLFLGGGGIIKDREFARFLDVRTGQYISSAFDDMQISVKNKSGIGCIMKISFIGTFEEESSTVPVERIIYAYVPFAAMEDGLQESDLLVISDEKIDT